MSKTWTGIPLRTVVLTVLLTVSIPRAAQAGFGRGPSEVLLVGTVQAFGPDGVWLVTPSGTVLVPQSSTFLVGDVGVHPSYLRPGTPVSVLLPRSDTAILVGTAMPPNPPALLPANFQSYVGEGEDQDDYGPGATFQPAVLAPPPQPAIYIPAQGYAAPLPLLVSAPTFPSLLAVPTSSMSVHLGGLSFSQQSSALLMPAGPVFMPTRTTSLRIGNLAFSQTTAPAAGFMPGGYMMGGTPFIQPQTVTSINLGRLQLSFVSPTPGSLFLAAPTPVYYVQPYSPVFLMPQPVAFAPSVTYLVPTTYGCVAMPMQTAQLVMLPVRFKHHHEFEERDGVYKVAVLQPNGKVVWVPTVAAFNKVRAQGATILGGPARAAPVVWSQHQGHEDHAQIPPGRSPIGASPRGNHRSEGSGPSVAHQHGGNGGGQHAHRENGPPAPIAHQGHSDHGQQNHGGSGGGGGHGHHHD